MSAAEELARYTPGSHTLITLGVFDGVHEGHLSLIETLKREANDRNLLPGVITFSPHPMEVLHPGEPIPLLTSLAERIQLLHEAGVMLVIPLTFTRELSQMSPAEFVQLLVRYVRMSGLILGPDFSLGKDRAGTIATLHKLGECLGFSVANVPPYVLDGQVVSSTAIRAALADGDVEDAARMLGRPFTICGQIVSTSHRGTGLGFPTANLFAEAGRALPRDGVYATIARIPDGSFGAVTNIGYRPTFGHAEHVVETHLLDFCGDIYGAALTVEFVARLRDEVAFQNPDALIAQIHRDVGAARSILGEHV